MSVLSQTRISTGGTLLLAGLAAWICSNRSFHCAGDLLERALGLPVHDLGLGLAALPGSRSPGSRFSLMCFQSLKYFGSGRPRRRPAPAGAGS